MLRSSSTRSVMVRRAFADALPIIIGYVPMGAAYGILARQSGIGLFPTVFMSLVVFAGASQFIAVGLLAGGGTALELVATTFFVNLRHLLMSATLSPHYRNAPRALLPFVAWGVTDETFAISIGRYVAGEADHRYGLALHYTAYASWVSGTVLGALAGSLIPPALQSSLEFSLYAMFAGLVVHQVTDRLHLAVAAGSAILCTAFSSFMGGTWPVIAAAVSGATLGMLLEGLQGKQGKKGRQDGVPRQASSPAHPGDGEVEWDRPDLEPEDRSPDLTGGTG
ncbi:MAG: AzlC family ABC transporter permease [bacterium]|nr:MAG: AzlC family ABC transporter permease [bacterium]